MVCLCVLALRLPKREQVVRTHSGGLAGSTQKRVTFDVHFHVEEGSGGAKHGTSLNESASLTTVLSRGQ